MTAAERRIGKCTECGEIQEMATKQLCYRCYRRHERERNAPRVVDRHNAGLRKEHQALVRGFAAVLTGLSDLRVSQGDVMEIRALLVPYLAPVAAYLANDRALLTPRVEQDDQDQDDDENDGEHVNEFHVAARTPTTGP